MEKQIDYRPHENEKKRALEYLNKTIDEKRSVRGQALNNKNEKEIQELEEIRRLLDTKKYGLIWEPHTEKVEERMKFEIPIFSEDKSKEIITNPEKKYNFILEGDNLHSLHLLEKTHRGKVDLIYLDPPYNTGHNTFKYNDDYVEKNDSFLHSKWLSFMERRLTIAKQLLSSSGAIFISINEEEQATLKLLGNEIFGDANFIGTIIWRKKQGGGQQGATFVTEHEYIFGWKRTNQFKWIDEMVEKEYDSRSIQRGYSLVKLEKWGSSAHKEDRESMYFSIKDPNGHDFYPIAPDNEPGRWRVGKTRMDNLIATDNIEWLKSNDRLVPFEKVPIDKTAKKIIKERSILYNFATNTDGDKLLTKIFGKKDVFSNPKPIELVEYLIKHTGAKLVLDFFAGSGTTGHSVMDWNAKNNDDVKFILATNNENDIAEKITYERIKRVILGYRSSEKVVDKLFEQKLRILDFTQLKNLGGKVGRLELLMKKIDKIANEHNEYDSLSVKLFDQSIALIGKKNNQENIVGLGGNLKYFKTDFISKNSYDVENQLIENVRAMIELENGVELENSSIKVIINLKSVEHTNLEGIEKIYMREQVHGMLNRDQMQRINEKGIKIIDIPENYFNKELREIGL